ncbi:MAG: hypothetical protein MUP86_02175 [Dehalococcoidia bacterium]|nr:hypothetical protein [Dehalococcoidia bacterium]
MFDPERTGRFIQFLAYAQKEIDHMNTTLPAFNLASRCPKCGMEGGGPDGHFDDAIDGVRRVLHAPDPFPVEYHAGGALPFGRFPCSLELHVEHLCRVCPRCDFGWAEACPQFPDNPITAVVSHVRPEVAAFALLMERELAKHDDRSGWKACNRKWLLDRLLGEAKELDRCLWGPSDCIGHEAADIANFAMMIADVGGALAPKGESHAED